MNKIIISVLVLFAFSWTSGVYADKGSKGASKVSPESVVTCGSGHGKEISYVSTPETINVEQCTPWEDSCAPCVISLESQGCEFVDVVVSHFGHPDTHTNTGTTYLMSCVKP